MYAKNQQGRPFKIWIPLVNFTNKSRTRSLVRFISADFVPINLPRLIALSQQKYFYASCLFWRTIIEDRCDPGRYLGTPVSYAQTLRSVPSCTGPLMHSNAVIELTLCHRSSRARILLFTCGVGTAVWYIYSLLLGRSEGMLLCTCGVYVQQ